LLFRLAPLRFSFIARESIHFAEGTSSNILRGAFGTIFRRLVCLPECPGASSCPNRANCPYARFFEPAAISSGPSGLADWPRPFVFRATHLDGKTFAPGEHFHFDLNLFDIRSSIVAYLSRTFAELAYEGLGPARRKVELTTVAQLDAPLTLDLSPASEPVSRILVRFVTPLELKTAKRVDASRPEFAVLGARIRDRISTLRALYGDGPLPIDFHQFGERAALVEMTRCELTSVDIRRRSSRTGQVHRIGGFIGEAEYEGDLTEFLPYLIAAKWTGVGRQTVWGKGEIAVYKLS
jgi:hypothetical protein